MRCTLIRKGIWEHNVGNPKGPNSVLGFWVIVIVVQVLGKYMIIRYLDP